MADDTSRPKAPGRMPGRGLGRGLSALIVNTESAPPPTHAPSDVTERRTPEASPAHDETAAALPGERLISIDHIRSNPQQPRTSFEPGALAELAASIREHGIIQPLIVTAADEPGHYWLVAGERRWRAAQMAELTEVPVTVREATSQQLLEWALVENIQRADLNALEEAAAYQTLVEEFGLTQAEVGRRVGKSRSAVANTLRLLHLPQPVQDALLQDTLSPGHARALLALSDEEIILEVLEQVLDRSLSVRQTEDLVRHYLTRPVEDPEPAEEMVEEIDEVDEQAAQEQVTFLENRLRDVLGTRVNLNRNRDGSGRLVIHFYNDEDLTGLYQLIAGPTELE